jgi:hypothetical protein
MKVGTPLLPIGAERRAGITTWKPARAHCLGHRSYDKRVPGQQSNIIDGVRAAAILCPREPDQRSSGFTLLKLLPTAAISTLPAVSPYGSRSGNAPVAKAAESLL